MEEIHEKAEKLIECNNSNVPGISRVTQGITDLLYMVQPEAEYSAFMAAIILDNPDFIETIEILKKLKLWTDKQNALYKEGCKIKFDTSY